MALFYNNKVGIYLTVDNDSFFLIEGNTRLPVGMLNDDLSSCDSQYPEFDIFKIRRPNNIRDVSFEAFKYDMGVEIFNRLKGI